MQLCKVLSRALRAYVLGCIARGAVLEGNTGEQNGTAGVLYEQLFAREINMKPLSSFFFYINFVFLVKPDEGIFFAIVTKWTSLRFVG